MLDSLHLKQAFVWTCDFCSMRNQRPVHSAFECDQCGLEASHDQVAEALEGRDTFGVE
jgi:hypothetical protein